MGAYIHQETRMFVADLFVIAKKKKEKKHLSNCSMGK